MPQQQLDSLTIQIQANATTANNSIDKLITKLNALSTVLGHVDTKGIQKFSSGMLMLSNSMRTFQSVKMPDFNRTAKGIEKLGTIDGTKLSQVSSGLIPLANGMRVLSGVQFDGVNLTNFINALTRFSNANIANINSTNLELLGINISNFANRVKSAADVSTNTIQLMNALAKLGSAGQYAGQVTTALPALSTALMKFITTLSGASRVSSETIAITTAIANLASAGNKAGKAAAGLETLGTKLSSIITKLSSLPRVDSSVVSLTGSLATLAGSFGRTNSGISAMNTGFGRSPSIIKKVASALNIFHAASNKSAKSGFSLASAIGKMYASYWMLFRVFNRLKKAIDVSSSLTEIGNVVRVTFGQYADEIDKLAETSIQKLGMSELSVKQYASRFQAMGVAMGFPQKQMKDMSIELTRLTADMASFYDINQADVAKDLTAIFTGMVVPLRKYGLDLTQATLKEWAMKNGLDSNIQSMTQAEKTLLRYKYVMANTTAAQGDFARTIDTWHNRVTILKESLTALASVIGTVLINVFKPVVKALNVALEHFTHFFKVVSEGLGAIFGWKFEINDTGITEDLETGAEAAEDTAGGLNNAAKAAKKLQQYTLGFDELHVISPDDGSDGSGGSGSGSAGGAGSGGDVSAKLMPTDSIFKRYQSDLDNLGKLGNYIGQKLQEAMDSINWDAIYKKASNFGKGLAEFLNGLISPELFASLGRTIAGAINTALHILDGFGTTFDWKNFGNSLASGLNAFMEKLDWKLAFKDAKTWGKGLADALNSFVSTLNFTNVGKTVANAINTAIIFALTAGENINFKQIGNKISNMIMGFFTELKVEEAAETINVWLKGVLDAGIALLDGTNFELIGQKIGTFLGELDVLEIAGKFAILLGKVVKAGVTLWVGSFEKAPIETAVITALGTVFIGINLLKPVAKPLAKAFGNAMAQGFGASTLLELVTTHIATPMIGAFTSAFSGLGAALLPVLLNPITWAIAAVGALVAYNVHEAVQPAIKEVDVFGDDISETTQSKVSPLIDEVRTLDDTLATIEYTGTVIRQSTVDDVGTKVQNIVNTITDGLSADKNDALANLNPLSRVMDAEEFIELQNKVTGFYDGLQTQTEEGQNRINEIFSNAKTERRTLTEEEKKEIDEIQSTMLDTGVSTLSENEAEYTAIMQRLKNNTTAISAEQGSEIIKNAKDTKDETIKHAQEQYDGIELEAAKLLNAGAINEEEYQKMIDSAQEAKDNTVTMANDQYDNIVAKTKEGMGDAAKYVDENTGDIKTKFQVTVDETKKSWNEWKESAAQTTKDIKESFKTEFAELKKSIDDKLAEADEALDRFIEYVVEGVKGIGKQLWDGVQEIWENLKKVGAFIWRGILNGLMEHVPSGMKGFISDMLENTQEAAQIHSPSKLFEAEVGVWIGKGIAKGISSETNDAVSEAKNMFNKVVGVFKKNVKAKVNVVSALSDDETEATESAIDSGYVEQYTALFDKVNSGFLKFKSDFAKNWESFIKMFTPSWTDYWNKTGKFSIDVFNSILLGFQKVIAETIQGLNSLVEAANKLSSLTGKSYSKVYGYTVQLADYAAIPRYEAGGFPNKGSLFIAREAGAEMVGNINGRTAVANNDQITTAIYNAVLSAMEQAMSTNENSQPIEIQNKLYLDGDVVYTNQQRVAARRGVNFGLGQFQR